MSKMNFSNWLCKAMQVLFVAGSKSPRLDAEILLELVTGKSRAFILAFGETLLTTEQELRLAVLLARREVGEPIAYLTGKREFWSLSLYVSSATIIPRPDTEFLVEQALTLLPDKPSRILDLGTGTGAIALALASERPDCDITAVDLIPEAIALALLNIEQLKINNVNIIQSRWFDALSEQKFDMIVSNPPYIDKHDPCLLQGDIRFEPLSALISSNKGTSDLNHIILHAYKYLVSGGWLIVEHGYTQGKFIRKLFIRAGYHNVNTYCGYSGNDLITLGNYNANT